MDGVEWKQQIRGLFLRGEGGCQVKVDLSMDKVLPVSRRKYTELAELHGIEATTFP
jgi:hypothetical protein